MGGGNWYVRVLVVTTGIGWVVMVDEVVVILDVVMGLNGLGKVVGH